MQMRQVFSLLLLFVVFGCTENTKRSNETLIVPETIDIGQVRAENSPINTSFSITNSSQDAVEIEKILSSCGCTVVDLPNKIIKANEKIDVPIKIDLFGRKGDFNIDLLVRTKSGQSHPILIKGKVIEDIWYAGQSLHLYIAGHQDTVSKDFSISTIDYPDVQFEPKSNDSDLHISELSRSSQSGETKTSFNVTLVDRIPSRFSIARKFYKHYQTFNTIRYHRNDLLSWIKHMPNASKQYDIALLLRVCDTWCQYSATSFSYKQIADLLKSFDADMLLLPASEQIRNFPNQIIHSLSRIPTKSGTIYFQPSLRDYFKSVFLCCNMKTESQSDDEVIMPISTFSEDSLFLKDGTSIIDQITRYSRYLLIEDSNVSSEFLQNYSLKNGLFHLEFTNISQCGSQSFCTLISRKRS